MNIYLIVLLLELFFGVVIATGGIFFLIIKGNI